MAHEPPEGLAWDGNTVTLSEHLRIWRRENRPTTFTCSPPKDGGAMVTPAAMHTAAYMVQHDLVGAVDAVDTIRVGLVAAVFVCGSVTHGVPVFLAVVPFQSEAPVEDDTFLMRPLSHSTQEVELWAPETVRVMVAAAVIRKVRPLPVPWLFLPAASIAIPAASSATLQAASRDCVEADCCSVLAARLE
jgi:hypothetical protein